MVEYFTITKNHLKLLKSMHIEWSDGPYGGSPCVNEKRPYGNSDVLGDVADIIGIKHDGDGCFEEEIFDFLRTLHKETATALQICLCTGNFKTGVYVKVNQFERKSWVRSI